MSNCWGIESRRRVVPMTPDEFFAARQDDAALMAMGCGVLVPCPDGGMDECREPATEIFKNGATRLQVCPAHESELRAIRAETARETAETLAFCAAILARQQGVAA